MIQIRTGDEADVDRVNAFYSAEGHSARVSTGERFVLAEDGKQLIGVVRLCTEHGHSILRTMRVRKTHQGQGIGKRMLQVFESLLPGSDCYCLPFAHLTAFYGRIGFVTIPVEQAPQHLQERYRRYCGDRKDMLVMKRAVDAGGVDMREKVFRLLEAQNGHFRYESGHHGNQWFDLEQLCLRPREVQPFSTELARRLAQYSIDGVCGALNEGAFLSLLVASELNVEFSYSERFDSGRSDTLYPVQYRIPGILRERVRGKRIAIVNDVINAGSAVCSTLADLKACGAQPVAVGALLILGDFFLRFAAENHIALQSLAFAPNNLWKPSECQLCFSNVPLHDP